MNRTYTGWAAGGERPIGAAVMGDLRTIWQRILLGAALVLLLPYSATWGQQPTQPSLRQERAQAVEQMRLKGYCYGYFDPDGDAAEILELQGPLSRRESRAFIRDLALWKQQDALLGEYFTRAVPLGDPRELETFKRAIEHGRAEGVSVSDKSAVLAMYERCKVFHIPSSTPPAKAAPSAPPPPPNPAGSPPKPKAQSLDEVLADASKPPAPPTPNMDQRNAPVGRSDPAAKPNPQPPRGPQTASVSAPKLTPDEEWAVIHKIRPCWNPPLGAKDADKIAVGIAFSVGRDGRVIEAKIIDVTRMHDKDYAAAANAALRAVLNPRCQPWPLPPEKYETWRNGRFTFDPHFF